MLKNINEKLKLKIRMKLNLETFKKFKNKMIELTIPSLFLKHAKLISFLFLILVFH